VKRPIIAGPTLKEERITPSVEACGHTSQPGVLVLKPIPFEEDA
jgi:hypothetical protein